MVMYGGRRHRADNESVYMQRASARAPVLLTPSTVPPTCRLARLSTAALRDLIPSLCSHLESKDARINRRPLQLYGDRSPLRFH